MRDAEHATFVGIAESFCLGYQSVVWRVVQAVEISKGQVRASAGESISRLSKQLLGTGPLILSAILYLSGCSSHLPTYRWTDHETAIQILSSRHASLSTLSASCTVRLTSTDGRSVHLSGAMVAQPPSFFRLRTWKLSHVLFDLTINPDGLWLLAPQQTPSDPDSISIASITNNLIRVWSVLVSRPFDSGQAMKIDDTGGRQFRWQRTWPDGTVMTWTLDRPTLTVRSCQIVPGSDEPPVTMLLDRYRILNGRVWPTNLKASGPAGTIEVWFDDIQFNQELAPTAFSPPRRAKRSPS